jgi:hypothetical protein
MSLTIPTNGYASKPRGHRSRRYDTSVDEDMGHADRAVFRKDGLFGRFARRPGYAIMSIMAGYAYTRR